MHVAFVSHNVWRDFQIWLVDRGSNFLRYMVCLFSFLCVCSPSFIPFSVWLLFFYFICFTFSLTFSPNITELFSTVTGMDVVWSHLL